MPWVPGKMKPNITKEEREGLEGAQEVTGAPREAGMGVPRVKVRWRAGTLPFYVIWFLKSHKL